jgi:arylsulfatase A-like enzyme/Tfp pilus assembly protein PilF
MSLSRKILGVALILTGIAYLGTLTFQAIERKKVTDQWSDSGAPAFNLPAKPRSVLLVTIDTTRADHLGAYGRDDVSTPALDRLAEQGIVFDNAMAVAPITLPSHTSILSGLYPPQHGVRNNGTHYVPEETITLAERYRDQGYRTSAFVSAAVLEKRYGLDQGFEVYDDDLSTSRARFPRVVPDRPASATVDSVFEWLDTIDQDEKFFSWVHFYDPHAAYNPPPPFRDYYPENPYLGEIAYLDSQIGRLLAHPRFAQDPDLVVIVMADHGESLGEHGEKTHAILAYQSTMHIPWIMSIGQGPAGVRIGRSVSQVDLVPTLIQLTDLPADDGLPGVSVLDQAAMSVDRPLYAEAFLPYYSYGWSSLRVMREGNWKYIDAPTAELYDLRRDPREITNLFSNDPGPGHDLKTELEEFLEANENQDESNRLTLDNDALKRLQGLGYIAMGNVTQIDDADRPDPKDVIHLHVGLERGRQLINDHLHEQAIEVLKQVLFEDPTNIAAMVDLAQALMAVQELDEARTIISDAMVYDPKSRRLKVMMANVELGAGNVDQARSLAEAVMAEDELDVDARIAMMSVLFRENRPVEARALLDAGLSLLPDDSRLNALYASRIEIPSGELAAAQSRLESVVAQDPFLPMAWVALSDLLRMDGKGAEAELALREGLQRTPDSGDLHGRLGTLLANAGGSDPNTELHLREAIRLSEPVPSELRTALGALLAERGDIQEAMKLYEMVLAEEPNNVGARNNRAISLYASGDAEAALLELETLTSQFPNFADAQNNMAAIAVELGRWPLAVTHAERAIELDSQSADAWNNLGLAKEALEDMGEALNCFEQSLLINPSYVTAKFNKGRVLKIMGQSEMAIESLTEVVKEYPRHANSHLLLGELYHYGVGDQELAKKHYNAFLSAAPKHTKAVEIRDRISTMTSPDA